MLWLETREFLKNLFKLIKSHRKIFYGLLGVFVFLGLFIFFKPYLNYWLREEVTTKTLDSLDLKDIDHLMIVAHPDDEAIWASTELFNEKYFVVCLTNNENAERKKEFEEVLATTQDVGLMLSYPDKIHGKKSDWDFCKESILKDLKTIISYKDWSVILTHNEDGEYGHIHHILTHKLVTHECDITSFRGEKKFFGKYYKINDLEILGEAGNLPMSLTDEQLKQKLELLKIYKSQNTTVEHLYHTLPYENVFTSN